jgi:hypothetical protein
MPLKGDANRAYMREYMRRRRASAAQAAGSVKPDVKPDSAEIARLTAELAQARARVAEQEAEITGLKQASTAKAARLAAVAAAARRAEAKAARLAATAAERPDVDAPTLIAEINKLNQKLEKERTRYAKLKAQFINLGLMFPGNKSLHPAEIKNIRVCLHPDSMAQIKRALVENDSGRIAKWEQRFERASQAFGGMVDN